MKDDALGSGGTRLGFHYFPDPSHYRDSDLRTWVPELRALGASWLTLLAPPNRAIPEAFLEGLMKAGIEPILHFNFTPAQTPPLEGLAPLIEAYGRWGLRYVTFFDRPNRRRAWAVKDWVQTELVERFIDLYLPILGLAYQAGLTPIFPPLQPGGDYWDTAFLRTALEALRRRGYQEQLKGMVIGALASPSNLPLNWGAGGPERWPGARPYHTPSGEEDHLGFRIFDWYTPITRAVLGYSLPLILFNVGVQTGDQNQKDLPGIDETGYIDSNLALARLSLGEEEVQLEEDPLEPLPGEILAVNFWLLTAQLGSQFEPQAWIKADGKRLPLAEKLRAWLLDNQTNGAGSRRRTLFRRRDQRPIAHYLLLPSYDWGVADWHLDIIRPFIKNHRPTIGFSLVEAAQATRVTVIGGPQAFPEEVLEDLRSAGCLVERVEGDGTSIASLLNDGQMR